MFLSRRLDEEATNAGSIYPVFTATSTSDVSCRPADDSNMSTPEMHMPREIINLLMLIPAQGHSVQLLQSYGQLRSGFAVVTALCYWTLVGMEAHRSSSSRSICLTSNNISKTTRLSSKTSTPRPTLWSPSCAVLADFQKSASIFVHVCSRRTGESTIILGHIIFSMDLLSGKWLSC